MRKKFVRYRYIATTSWVSSEQNPARCRDEAQRSRWISTLASSLRGFRGGRAA